MMADRRDLYDELKERNSIAQSARRKTGGKKKCLLPSDKLSASEIKKMNGEIVMYEMKKPISWSKFKGYPQDIQKEYLQFFADEFHATPGMLATVWGIHPQYACASMKKMGLRGILHEAQTKAGLMAFKEWMKQFSPENETQTIEEPKPPVEKKEKLVVPPFFNTITSGKIILEGKASEIGQTLFNMFQNETITMQVEFEVQKRKEELEHEEVD